MEKKPQHELLQSQNRYSRKNPPESILAAEDRLEEVNHSIEQIKTQLEFLSESDFDEIDDYDSWKSRAISALGWIRAEERFLEKWIKAQGKPNGDFSKACSQVSVSVPKKNHLSALDQIADDMRARIRTLAESMTAEYTPVYSVNNLPKSLEEAYERSNLLSGKLIDLQACFAQINAEWISYRLSQKLLSGAKAPLQPLLQSIQAEKRILKSYISRVTIEENISRKPEAAEN